MLIRVAKDIQCPNCGVGESHPNGEHILIRGFKVCDEHGNWWSQCLVCAGGYPTEGAFDPSKLVYNEANYDQKKGWFCS